MQNTYGMGGYEAFSYMQPPSSQQLALDVEAPERTPLPVLGGSLQVSNLLCLHAPIPVTARDVCVCVCASREEELLLMPARHCNAQWS